MMMQVGRDFFPAIDGGQIKLHVRAPAGTRIEATEVVLEAVEDKIRQVIPERERDLIVDDIGIPQRLYNLSFTDGSTIGPNDGVILVAKLIEFHIMRIRATPARLVGVVRATGFRRICKGASSSCVPREGRHRCRENQGVATSARSSGRKIGAFLNAILILKRCTQAIYYHHRRRCLKNCCGSASNSNNRSMAGSLLSYRAPRRVRSPCLLLTGRQPRENQTHAGLFLYPSAVAALS